MKKVLEDSNTTTEKKFLSYIQLILVFTIFGGGFDAIVFPPAMMFSEYFSIILIMGFGFLSIFSFLFIFIVLKLTNLIPLIDLSLIINELN